MSTNHEDFMLNTVPQLKLYLKQRGIQVSQDGKLKRKRELAELCTKAKKLELEKQCEDEDRIENLKTLALTTPEGVLNFPVEKWSNDFSGMKFTFADLFVYLVGKEDYNVDNLKSFKSLTGYKLAACGNVLELKRTTTTYHNNYVLVSFRVRPTQKSQVKDEGTSVNSYSGFMVLLKCGTVHSAFCLCKGASDGACRHIAASLFELEFTLHKTMSCTSVKCMWTQRSSMKTSKDVKVKNMEVKKLEYGKESLKSYTACKLETPTLGFENHELELKLAEGLRQCYPQSVWLQYIPTPKPVLIDDSSLQSTISNNVLVDHEEVVEYVEVYSMEECAQAYKTSHPISSVTNIVCEDFMKFMSSLFGEEQTKAISEKSQNQSLCPFWYEQRKGRLTASVFYKICHLKSSTDPSITLSDIFQYRPNITTLATEWGKQKEHVAADLYYSKMKSRHRNLVLKLAGLHVPHSAPFLGASADRIRNCDCCSPCVVEIKSKYSKKNLFPNIAATDMLVKNDSENLEVKEETSWNYQCQGQMALTGIHNCDLVIYTLKGICIINVKYNPQKWNSIFQKLHAFFKKNVIPELLTGRLKSEMIFKKPEP